MGRMKVWEALDKTKEYVKEHGFSIELGNDGGPRCFSGALSSAIGSTSENFEFRLQVLWHIHEIVGPSLLAKDLRRDGWNKKDAIAALKIARDCAIEEGK